MLIQLAEQLAVETPLGCGYAILVEAKEDDNWWTVVLSDSRALVTFRQEQLLAARSYSQGRGISDAQMGSIVMSRSSKSKKRKAWYRDYAKRTDRTARQAKRREQTFRRQAARRS